MFELGLLLAHSERWNLTSLVFIPLDLAGLIASLWLIVGAIKGILNPSEVSKNRVARARARQHAASEPQLLNALLAKKTAAPASNRLAPGSIAFPRHRQLNRFT